MARIEFEASQTIVQDVWDTIGTADLTVEHESKGRIELSDEFGNTIEFEGNKLAIDEDGGLVGGKVDQVTLSNADGELVEIKDFKISAQSLQAAFDANGFEGIAGVVLDAADEVRGSEGADWLKGYDGEDILTGQKGSDFLFGGAGDDQLVGGKGSDHFVFEANGSTDLVKDFDVDGNNADTIAVDAELLGTATWERDGNNLVVTFEDQGSIELKGVRPGEFSEDMITALPVETMI